MKIVLLKATKQTGTEITVKLAEYRQYTIAII